MGSSDMSSIEAAASSFAIRASTAAVNAKKEIEGVIAALADDPGGGLIVMLELFNTINRDLIIALAAHYRVPAIYFFRSFPDARGLISYGGDFAEQYPKAAGYIDRILKGEKPADLPIQMPTKVSLVINLKTAKGAWPNNPRVTRRHCRRRGRVADCYDCSRPLLADFVAEVGDDRRAAAGTPFLIGRFAP
jgi:ABC-type uncharacterized transport system substrate-binding protein